MWFMSACMRVPVHCVTVLCAHTCLCVAHACVQMCVYALLSTHTALSALVHCCPFPEAPLPALCCPALPKPWGRSPSLAHASTFPPEWGGTLPLLHAPQSRRPTEKQLQPGWRVGTRSPPGGAIHFPPLSAGAPQGHTMGSGSTSVPTPRLGAFAN